MSDYPVTVADVLVQVLDTGRFKTLHFSGGNNLVPYIGVGLEWNPPSAVIIRRAVMFRYAIPAAGNSANVQLSIQLPLMSVYAPLLAWYIDENTTSHNLARSWDLGVYLPAGTLLQLTMTDTEGIPAVICYLVCEYPEAQPDQVRSCGIWSFLKGDCYV